MLPTDASQFAIVAPWYVLAAGLALFVPIGMVMLGVAGMAPDNARRTALAALGAVGLASLAYWAVGFGLQFGGIGLIYPEPELKALVWEWSPLSVEWGSGWGVAGLSGWMVAGEGITWLVYGLFLAHFPWMITTTVLIAMALRGRASLLATLVIAPVVGGIVYPLAGNWIQGGGWLNSLGRNLLLGHGFIDFGGAGSVYLIAAAFGLTALMIWDRPVATDPVDNLPRMRMPLLVLTGAFLLLPGIVGWLWANPLQTSLLNLNNLFRGTVNVLLAAAAGALVPLLYSWFVTSEGHPGLGGRGIGAGMVAGLAVGPFVQPGVAFFLGLAAGATVPFVTYLIDNRLKLGDVTGIVSTCGLPAILGLLLVGLFADGAAGLGWQMTSVESHLGVTGQGVSGLLVAAGFQPDFPGQLQAQLIGVTALVLWGTVMGLLVNYPLALISQGLGHSERQPPAGQRPEAITTVTAPEHTTRVPERP